MAPRTAASSTGLRRSARLPGPSAASTGRKVDTKENKITKPEPAPKPKQARYDCITCDRTLASSSFPKHLPTDNCDHLINTCKACLKQWIAVQLESTTYDNITCPECPQPMQNSDVKIHAAKNVYQKFDELERRGIADKTPGWRWCLAPRCRAGQVHLFLIEATAATKTSTPPKTRSARKGPARKVKKAENTDHICTCNACGAKACVNCDRPWHENETCEQYQARMKKEGFEKEEAKSLKAIEQQAKPCPGCKKNIIRNGGCDHMHCTQCNTNFCYICLRTYNTIRDEGHGPGCTYSIPGRVDPHAMPQAQPNGAPGFMQGIMNGLVMFVGGGIGGPRAPGAGPLPAGGAAPGGGRAV